jgi:hypothetical protein
MHGCLKTSEAKPGGVRCGKSGTGNHLDRLPSHTPITSTKSTTYAPKLSKCLGARASFRPKRGI